MRMTPEEIGTMLRSQRESVGLTLRKAAGLSKISPALLSTIENAHISQCRRLSPESAKRLFDVIKLPRRRRNLIVSEWCKPDEEVLAKWDSVKEEGECPSESPRRCRRDIPHNCWNQ